MKKLFCVTFLFLNLAHAAEEKTAEKRDFSLLCEISKLSQSLSKNPQFSDKADRIYTVSKMQESVIKTDEVNAVLRAVAATTSQDRVKTLKQAATETGLKNWSCPSLKYLYQ